MKPIATAIIFIIAFFVLLVIYLWEKPEDNFTKLRSKSNLMRDYQIELHMDTVWVYDGDRLVGSYISTWNNQIDTILITDNQ